MTYIVHGQHSSSYAWSACDPGPSSLLDLVFIQAQAALGLAAQQAQATPGLPVTQVLVCC